MGKHTQYYLFILLSSILFFGEMQATQDATKNRRKDGWYGWIWKVGCHKIKINSCVDLGIGKLGR